MKPKIGKHAQSSTSKRKQAYILPNDTSPSTNDLVVSFLPSASLTVVGYVFYTVNPNLSTSFNPKKLLLAPESTRNTNVFEFISPTTLNILQSAFNSFTRFRSVKFRKCPVVSFLTHPRCHSCNHLTCHHPRCTTTCPCCSNPFCCPSCC